MVQHIQLESNIGITEEVLVALADGMAAAAVSFSAHGYDEFIRARELFKTAAHLVFETHTEQPPD